MALLDFVAPDTPSTPLTPPFARIAPGTLAFACEKNISSAPAAVADADTPVTASPEIVTTTVTVYPYVSHTAVPV